MTCTRLFITNDLYICEPGVLHADDIEAMGGSAQAVSLLKAVEIMKNAPEENGDSARLPPNIIELDADELKALARGAAATYSSFGPVAQELLYGHRDRVQAVHRLRCVKRFSWRSLAAECEKLWKGDWGSNQLMGIALCQVAAELRNEDSEKRPWNQVD